MRKLFQIAVMVLFCNLNYAQTNPIILNWLQNRTGIKGRHYVTGNSTPIQDNDSANVQSVQYSTNWVYVKTTGVPAYITGPFTANPSITTNQNAIFKLSLNPGQNLSGTYTATGGGNIGVFVNGAALFDYRDGFSWGAVSQTVAANGDGVWKRDAVVAEKGGFDCAKGHPANGNYHHHQNPSAFNLDLNVISTICNLYTADGLYKIDSTKHSPLIGFAYDGFPIYGAYGFKNTNGTGGIVRMKSSYSLRNITTRTVLSDGTDVADGPAVSANYPLGYFKEDYQYNATSSATPEYLDDHNGRFCVTPEYPNGKYCYFATVDSNWNSAFPYVVGLTYYGVKNGVKVATITEAVTSYVAPNPSISISASSTNACSGTTITFTATPTNGGSSPSYQWKKNGVNVGTNSDTYSSNSFANADSVICILTTLASTIATSNTVKLTINANVTPTFTQVSAVCSGESFNLPTTSNNSITGTWSPGINNTSTTTYTFTPTAGTCAVTTSMTVSVKSKSSTVQNTTIYPNALPYSWNGTSYTTGGTYVAHFTNAVGCDSSVALNLTINTNSTLNLKLYLEGFYSNGTMLANLYNLGRSTASNETDSITVNLWKTNNLNAASADFSKKAILLTDGTTSLQFPFTSTFGNNYYISVKHRNSIETWSSQSILFAETNSYDFTTAQTKAYSNNLNSPMKSLGNGKYGLYSGDVNQDGTIDIYDLQKTENDYRSILYGYNASDCNGDGYSNATDILNIGNNTSGLIFYSRPF